MLNLKKVRLINNLPFSKHGVVGLRSPSSSGIFARPYQSGLICTFNGYMPAMILCPV